jgi:hypothetical protein
MTNGTQSQYAIAGAPTYGPTFGGGGHDIYIIDKSNIKSGSNHQFLL